MSRLVEFKTKVGTLYLEISRDSVNYCALLDSNKKWITNIFSKSIAEKVEDIKDVSDLVDLGIVENITWAVSLEKLANEMNDLYDTAFTDENINDYMFLNKCGETYFIADYD